MHDCLIADRSLQQPRNMDHKGGVEGGGRDPEAALLRALLPPYVDEEVLVDTCGMGCSTGRNLSS